jgi:hypothetical protein
MILSDLLFWLPLMVFDEGIILTNGMDGSYVILGNIIYTYVVVTVCLLLTPSTVALPRKKEVAATPPAPRGKKEAAATPPSTPDQPIQSGCLTNESAVAGLGPSFCVRIYVTTAVFFFNSLF